MRDLHKSFDIGHRFANRLDVYIHPATAENGNGTVTVAGALYDAETSSLTHDRVVLCHEKGCTLTALPEAGYRFEGWYSAADYKTRLSTSASYAYIPTSPEAAIFPKFTVNTRPLDDGGTANCYIAPELNTSYSFDATTMGNAVQRRISARRAPCGVRKQGALGNGHDPRSDRRKCGG